MTTDIVYYTDNSLPENLDRKVRIQLVKAAEGKQIICVSQKPMNYGRNIYVGDIGRSHLSMYKQILVGAETSKATFIALAEHDCFYTGEHFNWTPPDRDTFYYNLNNWLTQSYNGEYSFADDRKPMSQLICARKIMCEAAKERIRMLEQGWQIRRGAGYAVEFGIRTMQDSIKKWVPRGKRRHHDYGADWDALMETGVTFRQWKFGTFKTELPNLDVRHGGNFSGRRRANKRTMELPYWGRFEDVMNHG